MSYTTIFKNKPKLLFPALAYAAQKPYHHYSHDFAYNQENSLRFVELGFNLKNRSIYFTTASILLYAQLNSRASYGLIEHRITELEQLQKSWQTFLISEQEARFALTFVKSFGSNDEKQPNLLEAFGIKTVNLAINYIQRAYLLSDNIEQAVHFIHNNDNTHPSNDLNAEAAINNEAAQFAVAGLDACLLNFLVTASEGDYPNFPTIHTKTLWKLLEIWINKTTAFMDTTEGLQYNYDSTNPFPEKKHHPMINIMLTATQIFSNLKKREDYQPEHCALHARLSHFWKYDEEFQNVETKIKQQIDKWLN